MSPATRLRNQCASRVIVVAAILCCLSHLAHGGTRHDVTVQRRYKVIDCGPSTVRGLMRTPGLNDRGDVAFWNTPEGGTARGILRKSDESVDILGLAEYPAVYPADVNDAQTVVGSLQAADDLRFTQAFGWTHGRLETLPPIGGKYSVATAINSAGVIAGGAQTASESMHAVLWRSTVAEDLGVLAQGDYSVANDLNDAGSVVGISNVAAKGNPHAFLWSGGRLQRLAEPPETKFCVAQAINDRGEIAGTCGRGGEGTSRAMLWRDTQIIDLGILGDEDETTSTALDINNHSQVVGASEIEDGKLRAFLWENGSMRDLNELIPENSGWLLLVASRINNAGEILGRGHFQDGIHEFLLMPQPTPRSVALPAAR